MPPPCFIQLGRYGDIMNALPLVWEASRCGPRPFLFVGMPFVDLLDGVSYCRPLVQENWEDVHAAVQSATKAQQGGGIGDVFVMQVHGNYPQVSQTRSYATDSWANIGRTDWGALPLVFDKRDKARETKLLESLGQATPHARRRILVSHKGESSPFNHGPRLTRALVYRFDADDCDVIDISNLRCARIYDLLALFDISSALVTIDTATMHLAHASRVPVFALASSAHHGWGATPRYPGQVWRCEYNDYLEKEASLLDELERAVREPRFERTLHHVWSDWDRDPEASRRHRIAERTWLREAETKAWRHHPFQTGKRMSSEIGDPRPVPLVNEMVEEMIGCCREEDMIVLTNDDVSFAHGLTDTLLDFRHQCGWAYRYDFKSIHREVTQVGLAAGHKYPGVDLFVFTPRWWREAKLPDMWLAREQWDLLFRSAMRLSGGVEIPLAIAHEQHPSFWSSNNNENVNPANLWNKRQCLKWHTMNGLEVKL